MLRETVLADKTINKYKYLIAHPFLHRNFVVVSDGVFTQEVKFHHIFLTIILRVQFDVFNPQRTAAHSVRGLSFLLLVTRSKSQLEEVAYQESLTKVSLQKRISIYAAGIFGTVVIYDNVSQSGTSPYR